MDGECDTKKTAQMVKDLIVQFTVESARDDVWLYDTIRLLEKILISWTLLCSKYPDLHNSPRVICDPHSPAPHPSQLRLTSVVFTHKK